VKVREDVSWIEMFLENINNVRNFVRQPQAILPADENADC
jgi:hypothetical protein